MHSKAKPSERAARAQIGPKADILCRLTIKSTRLQSVVPLNGKRAKKGSTRLNRLGNPRSLRIEKVPRFRVVTFAFFEGDVMKVQVAAARRKVLYDA